MFAFDPRDSHALSAVSERRRRRLIQNTRGMHCLRFSVDGTPILLQKTGIATMCAHCLKRDYQQKYACGRGRTLHLNCRTDEMLKKFPETEHVDSSVESWGSVTKEWSSDEDPAYI